MKYFLVFAFLNGFVDALVLESPCCSRYLQVSAAFGMKLPLEGFNKVEIMKADPFDACSSLNPKTNFTGKVALIQRGDCNFTEKVLHVQKANALAAIVMDNVISENWGVIMKGDDKSFSILIPSVFISKKVGAVLLNELEERSHTDEKVLVTLNQTGEVEFRMKQLGFMKSAVIYIVVSFFLFIISSSSCVFVATLLAWFQQNARTRASKLLKTKTFTNHSNNTIEPQQEDHVAKQKNSDSKKKNSSILNKNQQESLAHDSSTLASSGEEKSTCCICLGDYEEGDLLKILPCNHEFHSSCIDPWLEKKSGLCPLCKQDALPNVKVYTDLNDPFDQIAELLHQNSWFYFFVLFAAVVMCIGIALTAGTFSL